MKKLLVLTTALTSFAFAGELPVSGHFSNDFLHLALGLGLLGIGLALMRRPRRFHAILRLAR